MAVIFRPVLKIFFDIGCELMIGAAEIFQRVQGTHREAINSTKCRDKFSDQEPRGHREGRRAAQEAGWPPSLRYGCGWRSLDGRPGPVDHCMHGTGTDAGDSLQPWQSATPRPGDRFIPLPASPRQATGMDEEKATLHSHTRRSAPAPPPTSHRLSRRSMPGISGEIFWVADDDAPIQQ
jgi:hypothetical protein